MVTATPDTLGQVLGQVVQSAADAAAGAPQKMMDVFEQAGRDAANTVEQAEQLPADALAALKRLVDPPDWTSLLVFVLLKVADLDPAHLSVGSMKPDGWSRTITLTYTLEPGKSVTLGFAITDPGTTHGIVLQATAGLDLGPTALGSLVLKVTSQGDAGWRFAFSGGLERPAQQAAIDARLSWDPGIAVGDDIAGLTLGALRLQTALSTLPGAPLYAVTLGFGEETGRPGVEAKVDLGKLLGALGAIVHVAAIDQSYSPRVVLTQGAGPQFSLGERSSAWPPRAETAMADANIDVGVDLAGHPGLQQSSVELDVVASADLDLAGLRLAVDKARLSLSLTVQIGPDGPALTPAFALHPPEGASADLDLPGFSGGGYLARRDNGEWQGALAASLGPVSVSGFGILTTDRFSLLVLVAATLAVIVSGDGVVIVGRLAITLPFEQVALIRLEALVLATIDAHGLALDATLANSHIVGIPVEGDIKLRILTGDHALFAFSAGGFHPSFPPPEGMGGMKRIGTEISPGPFLRTRFAAYLAVTTSSVQFGAHVELEAGIAGFGIKGHFDFDALFVFDPVFGFQVDFSAGVSIECADFDVGSIELDGHFSGTSPWRIRGHAEIDILFFSVDVDIPEITFGSADAGTLPPARDPLSVITQQLGVPANWTATSRAVPDLVRLRPGVAEDHAAVHPMAELAFRQTAVPLDVELQRMDGLPLPAATTLRVAAAPGQQAVTMTQDQFPPAQFRTMDDKDKLASSGYARFDAGFDVDSQGAASGDSPQGRDDIHPEIAVLAEDFFLPWRVCALADGVVTGVGHPKVPEAELQPFLTLLDPGVTVVASVDTLRDASTVLADAYAASGDVAMSSAAGGVGLAAQHGAVASALISDLAAQAPSAAAGLQVARAWEVG